MALVNNSPTNTRLLTDTAFVKSASLQEATASAGIDLVQAVPYPTTEQVIVKFNSSIVSSSLAGGITASFRLQDSANNISFTNITELAGYSVLSVNGVGVAATSQQVLLPPSVRRYVRVAGTFTDASAAATTNYTGSITASLLF